MGIIEETRLSVVYEEVTEEVSGEDDPILSLW
jgi:hypothetical protein